MSDNRGVIQDLVTTIFFHAVSRKSGYFFQSLIGKNEIVPSVTGQKVSVFEFFRLQNG